MSDIPKIELGVLLDFAKAKQEAKAKIEKLTADLKSEAISLGYKIDDKDLKSYVNQFLKAQEQMGDVVAKTAQKQRAEVEKLAQAQAKAINKAQEASFAQQQKNLAAYQKSVQEEYNTNNVKSSKYWNGRFSDSVNSQTATSTELKKMSQYYSNLEKETLKAAQAQEQYNKSTKSLSINKDKFSAQIDALLKNNSKLAGTEFETSIRKLQSESKSFDSQFQLTNATKQLQTFTKQADAAGLMGNKVFPELVNNIKKMATWAIGGTAIFGTINSIKQMVSNVIELDTAMTDLYKVTDETDSTYQKFLTNANDKAIQLGTSVKDLVSSTADFAKLGYNLQDSAKLANVATLYSNVGDVDIDTGTKDIVTAMKSFNIQASDAISIIDRLNEVSNKYAVSSADLGEGLKNSASALAVAGNSIDQSIAMLTGMTEITQDASESGNALKVLSLRLRGAEADLDSMGESTDGLVTSTSKLRSVIKGFSGVDIMKDENTFKSTYQIMDEISKVYNNLTDVSKAGLLETIAGKQRGNQVAALLTNMAQANNALTTSLNSQGSAQKEQDKWMESIDAKTKQFGATSEKVSQQVVDSNLIKGAVDTGTGLMGAVSWLIDKLGTIPTLATAAVTALSGIKNAGKVRSYEYALPFQEAA